MLNCMRLYSKGFPRNTASSVLFSGIALSVLVVFGGVCGVSGFCGVWAVSTINPVSVDNIRVHIASSIRSPIPWTTAFS